MMVIEDKVSGSDSPTPLMSYSDSDGINPITLLDKRDSLKDYSISRLRTLASELINSLNDLDKDKEDIKKVMKNYEEEVIGINIQMDEITNAWVEKIVNEVSKQDFKGKGEESKIQLQLEEELTSIESDLSTLS